jgi:hypothetical protein
MDNFHKVGYLKCDIPLLEYYRSWIESNCLKFCKGRPQLFFTHLASISVTCTGILYRANGDLYQTLKPDSVNVCVCEAIVRHLGFLHIHCVQKLLYPQWHWWNWYWPEHEAAHPPSFCVLHTKSLMFGTLLYIMDSCLWWLHYFALIFWHLIFTVLLFYHGVWPNVEPHSRPSFCPQGFIRRSCIYSWIITGTVCFRDIHCYGIKYPFNIQAVGSLKWRGNRLYFLITAYLSFSKVFFLLCI